MKVFIVGIERPRDIVRIIDLEVVPAGVYGVAVTSLVGKVDRGLQFCYSGYPSSLRDRYS